jgi:hypothetical protein
MIPEDDRSFRSVLSPFGWGGGKVGKGQWDRYDFATGTDGIDPVRRGVVGHAGKKFFSSSEKGILVETAVEETGVRGQRGDQLGKAKMVVAFLGFWSADWIGELVLVEIEKTGDFLQWRNESQQFSQRKERTGEKQVVSLEEFRRILLAKIGRRASHTPLPVSSG